MKAFFDEYLWGKRAYLTYWYAFLFSLPFSWRKVLIPAVNGGAFNEYMDISLYIGDILILLTLLFILRHKENKKSILQIMKMFHVEQFLVGIFLSYLIVSLVWSPSTPLLIDGIWGFIRIITICLIFVFILNNGHSQYNCSTWNNIKYFTFVFSLTLAIQSIIAILQFINNHSIGLNFIGESNISQYLPGIAKIDIGRYVHIRSYGTFLHPNILAGYLATGLLFVLVYIKKSKKMFHVEQLYYLLVIILLILGLLTSFSKGAIVSLAIVLPLFLFHVEQKLFNTIRNNVKRDDINGKNMFYPLFHVEQWILIGIIITTVVIFYTTGQAKLVQSVNERVNILNSYSVSDLDVIIGQGIGQDVYNLGINNKNLPLWQYQPIHNIYIQLIIELGIIGSGILAAIIVSFIKRIVPRGTIPWNIAPILCLGTLAMFDHYLWDIYTGQVLVALTLAWSYRLGMKTIDK